MEGCRRDKLCPRWRTLLGASALAVASLITTSGCASGTSTNEPITQEVAPVYTNLPPDGGPIPCTVEVVPNGNNLLRVSPSLGAYSIGVTSGTFTATDRSQNTNEIIDSKPDVLHRATDLSDPDLLAVNVTVSGWANYGNAHGDSRSFSCSKNFPVLSGG